MNISFVTAVRNRTNHLRVTAALNSQRDIHNEHLIVDWGTAQPIARNDLPDDPRIRLIRVNDAADWWLTHAYNLGFAIAAGEFVFKLDADIALTDVGEKALKRAGSFPELMCTRLTHGQWFLDGDLFETPGSFLAKKSALSAVRGFNPYIRRWGWDDIDLFARIFSSGATVQAFPGRDFFSEFKHDDDLRVAEVGGRGPASWFHNRVNSAEVKWLCHIRNQEVARLCVRYGVHTPTFFDYEQKYRGDATAPLIDTRLDRILNGAEYVRVIELLYQALISAWLRRYSIISGVARRLVHYTSLDAKVETLKRLGVLD